MDDALDEGQGGGTGHAQAQRKANPNAMNKRGIIPWLRQGCCFKQKTPFQAKAPTLSMNLITEIGFDT